MSDAVLSTSASESVSTRETPVLGKVASTILRENSPGLAAFILASAEKASILLSQADVSALTDFVATKGGIFNVCQALRNRDLQKSDVQKLTSRFDAAALDSLDSIEKSALLLQTLQPHNFDESLNPLINKLIVKIVNHGREPVRQNVSEIITLPRFSFEQLKFGIETLLLHNVNGVLDPVIDKLIVEIGGKSRKKVLQIIPDLLTQPGVSDRNQAWLSIVYLSHTQNPSESNQYCFDLLKNLDERSPNTIAVICDRLMKALTKKEVTVQALSETGHFTIDEVTCSPKDSEYYCLIPGVIERALRTQDPDLACDILHAQEKIVPSIITETINLAKLASQTENGQALQILMDSPILNADVKDCLAVGCARACNEVELVQILTSSPNSVTAQRILAEGLVKKASAAAGRYGIENLLVDPSIDLSAKFILATWFKQPQRSDELRIVIARYEDKLDYFVMKALLDYFVENARNPEKPLGHATEEQAREVREFYIPNILPEIP